MKNIKELRSTFNWNIQRQDMPLKSFLRKSSAGLIDWDVRLSVGYNLQRDYVWNPLQKEELIWSVLYGRKIPSVSIISIYKNGNELFQIIDGKQRLTTLIHFIEEKFPIHVDKKPVLWTQLPDDYISAILNFYISFDTVYEPIDKVISDEDKVRWFTLINFSGTPQDLEHRLKLQQEVFIS